ncbi:MAG: hypothetical protein EXR79_02990, partial [Myxococcales bacterium]|nr:hypothetical protein [Myxococcales bacterium]
MRNQQLARPTGVALFAVLLSAVGLAGGACSESIPDHPTGGASDLAGGVDAEFGIETFALTVPTLTRLFPTTNVSTVEYDSTAQNKTAFTLKFGVTDFTVGAAAGKIVCVIDGGVPTAYASTTIVFPDLGPALAMHHVPCWLTSPTGEQLANPESHVLTHVYVTQALSDVAAQCASETNCLDDNVCSTSACVGGKCQFAPIPLGCCVATADCKNGFQCLNNKCTNCQVNGECNDDYACTKDTCDLSGIVGKCIFVKDESCCLVATDT